MKNVMLDLETLSTDSNAVIISISAVQFDLKTGEIGDKFEVFLDKKSQLENNGVIDIDTIDWWLSQDKKAQKSLFKSKPESVTIALYELNNWFDKIKPNQLWGNGSSFDNVILRNLYKRHDIDINLPFWIDRDVRTIVDLSDLYVKDTPFEGTPHNGIDDCLHQIKYCVKAYQSLKVNKNEN